MSSSSEYNSTKSIAKLKENLPKFKATIAGTGNGNIDKKNNYLPHTMSLSEKESESESELESESESESESEKESESE